jgi:OOP family OmpA-OmpF porin
MQALAADAFLQQCSRDVGTGIGMRFFGGFAVLLLGLVMLGYWGQQHQAIAIESRISEAAAAIVSTSLHGAHARVSGRDITVDGLADTEAERQRLIAALQAVPGRRMVNDRLSVLPVAAPYLFSLSKEAGRIDLAVSGNVPGEAARHELTVLAGPSARDLTLASGAPDNWLTLARTAIAALGPLDFGRAELTNGHLRLVGQARTPVEAGRARAALATLPQGIASNELSLLDDGTPPVWTVEYDATSGARLSGKLPPGLEPATVAAALGLTAIQNSARVAMIGAKAGVGPLGILAPWLPQLETLHAEISAQGAELVLGVGAGTDIDLLDETIGRDLAAAAAGKVRQLNLRIEQITPEQPEGAHRSNAATGQEEMLSGGYWLPVARLVPSHDACTMATNAILSRDQVGFLAGSDRLDIHARRVINQLAAVALPCTRGGRLQALLGGHTDSVGDAQINLGLSQRRATALRLALIARGISAADLRAQGYGDQRRIASNDSAAGRAANGRMTIEWSQ